MANNNDLLSMSTMLDALPAARKPAMSLESKLKKLSISSAVKKPRKTNNKTGLQFMVSYRFAHLMKKGKHSEYVSAKVPVYLAGVLEYLAAEIMELAGNEAGKKNKTKIEERHIHRAMMNDGELNMLHRDWAYANGLIKVVQHSRSSS